MKVHFINENSLEALRTNIKENLRHYSDESNDWIYEYFDKETPFKEYKIEFPEFKLITDSDDTVGTDVQNTIALYSSMKNLSDTQAADKRLWIGMCHCDFWEFLHKRWNMSKTKIPKETDITTRYFFAHNKKRSLFTNSLAKLWWVGRLTYDETKNDPFELTKYLSTDYATKVMILFSNNYMSNKNIAVGLLSALKQLEKLGFTLKGRAKRDIYYEATKYLNVLGGSYILDYFTSEEISEKIINYMNSLK